MRKMDSTRVIGLVWMAVWALVSLVVIAVNNDELRQSDALFLPFVFPGVLFPYNFGPVDLFEFGFWRSATDFAFDVGVGRYTLFDLLTVALAVTSVLALLPALRSRAETVTRVAWILGVVHVVLVLNAGLFSASGYSENGTYLLGAVVLVVGLALAWWPFARRSVRSAAAASTGPAVGAPGPASTAQFVVQTATGMTDWLTWDQVAWMAQNGQLQPTTLVYDGLRQVTTPAGSLPGLFT